MKVKEVLDKLLEGLSKSNNIDPTVVTTVKMIKDICVEGPHKCFKRHNTSWIDSQYWEDALEVVYALCARYSSTDFDEIDFYQTARMCLFDKGELSYPRVKLGWDWIKTHPNAFVDAL